MMIPIILEKCTVGFGTPEQNRELFSALNNRILNLIYSDKRFTHEDWVVLYTLLENRNDIIFLTKYQSIQRIETLYPNLFKHITVFAESSIRFSLFLL